MRQSIDIRIERLRVTDRQTEPETIAQEIRTELVRLLGNQETQITSTRIEEVAAPRGEPNPGIAAARAIHKGMTSNGPHNS